MGVVGKGGSAGGKEEERKGEGAARTIEGGRGEGASFPGRGGGAARGVAASFDMVSSLSAGTASTSLLFSSSSTAFTSPFGVTALLSALGFTGAGGFVPFELVWRKVGFGEGGGGGFAVVVDSPSKRAFKLCTEVLCSISLLPSMAQRGS